MGTPSGIREFGPLGSLNGVVGSEMDEVGVFIKRDVLRNVAIIFIRRRCHDLNRFALNSGFFDSLGGPCAGIDIVRRFARRQKIHGDHAKLHAGPSLDKKHLKIIPQIQQPFGSGHRIVDDVVKFFGPVTDFGNGHTGSFEVQKIFPDFFEHDKGQGCRSRIEVVDSFRRHFFLH